MTDRSETIAAPVTAAPPGEFSAADGHVFRTDGTTPPTLEYLAPTDDSGSVLPAGRHHRNTVIDALIRYGAAVAIVFVAVRLKVLLIPQVGQDAPSLIFFGTVMVAAWYGGFGPGVLATVLAALSSNYYFVEPFYQLDYSNHAVRWRTALFVSETLFISVLCDMLMRARRRAESSERATRRLERRILEVGEAEQRRIGHDLHDGLGQHLTGVAFLSRLLTRHLTTRGVPEADEATKIEQLVNKAVTWTRTLAAGLSPVEVDAGGLPSALRQLGLNTDEIFSTRCAVRCPERLPPLAGWAPTHLYRVAQEAVNNAVKHGGASHLWIELAARDDGRQLVLTVRDDGVGIRPGAGGSGGMGLQTMAYRARIIGGTLDVRRGEAGGTVVTCTCPTNVTAAAAAVTAHHATPAPHDVPARPQLQQDPRP